MLALTTTVSHDLVADVTVVRARGCLSLVTAPVMRAALLKCIAECPSAVVVDVTGCDSGSAAALTVFPAAAYGRAAQPTVPVLLCGPDRWFLRNGGLAALGTVPVYGTRVEALNAVEEARAAQRQVRLHCHHSVNAPRQAREAVSTACDDWDLGHLRSAAVLIISELVTNAIRHAGTDVDVEAMVRGTFLHLRVRDASPVPPSVAELNPFTLADHGRGMPIVAQLSTSWGCVVNSTATGKVVWATLRTRPIAS